MRDEDAWEDARWALARVAVLLIYRPMGRLLRVLVPLLERGRRRG